MLDLFTLLVFLAVFLAVMAVLSHNSPSSQDKALHQRLSALCRDLHPDGNSPLDDDADPDTILRQIQRVPLTSIPLLGRWFAPSLTRLWSGLQLLGWADSLARRGGILALPCLLVGIAASRDLPSPLLYAPLIAVLLFGLVSTVLYTTALQKRIKTLRHTLPDAIDAITRICRAGVPISNAFSMASEHLTGPLAHEFNLVDHWVHLGVPLRQAIMESAQRMRLPEYRFFAVIVIINQEAGGRLSDTLERLTSTLRARLELDMKIKAKTSEVRASAKIVAALVPGVLGYMSFNAPQDFRFLMSDPVGQTILAYGLGSVCLGLLVVHLMIRRVV